jgi:hypothetical protein
MIAAKYRCSVFDAPKFYEKWLTAQNDKEKKRNAPTIKWLKRHGLWASASKDYSEWLKRHGFWASAKALINSGEDYTEYPDKNGETHRMFFSKGSGSFEAVIGYQGADGRNRNHNFLIPNSFSQGRNLRVICRELRAIHLSPVKTKAQLSREVRRFKELCKELWPARKLLRETERNFDQAWRVVELRSRLRILRQKGTDESGKNLCEITYRNPRAKELGKVGMCLRHFRHLYPKKIFDRARAALGDELPDPIRAGSQLRKQDTEGVKLASQRANDEKDDDRYSDHLYDTSQSAHIDQRDGREEAKIVCELLANEVQQGNISSSQADGIAKQYGKKSMMLLQQSLKQQRQAG